MKPKPDAQTATPPAKRWRNYYRIYRIVVLGQYGPVFPGIHPGPTAFASQEIAEQRAFVFCKMCNPPNRTLIEFAGAYPEGELAN